MHTPSYARMVVENIKKKGETDSVMPMPKLNVLKDLVPEKMKISLPQTQMQMPRPIKLVKAMFVVSEMMKIREEESVDVHK